MKLEDQVVSLPLAKKLKELGVKQESLFIWSYYPHVDGYHRVPEFNQLEDGQEQNGLNISAFTVAELGEMLPYEIAAETINKAYPMPVCEDDNDEYFERLEEAREKIKDVFKDLDTDYDQFDDGMPYSIKRDYHSGKTMRYWQDTDDWEGNYTVIEISGDTEADARAKMLIYLIENNLITV